MHIDNLQTCILTPKNEMGSLPVQLQNNCE